MKTLNLLPQNSPMLKMTSGEFNFSKENAITEAQEIFDILKNSMIANNGLGLSAIQVGIPLRVFVIGDPTNPDSIIPVFNPVIVDIDPELEYYEEGCLSFPGLFMKVKRPKSIRARFANIQGKVDTAKFTGMTARVFQHEFDHMDGILYTSRASAYHRDKALNEQKKLNRLRKRNRG